MCIVAYSYDDVNEFVSPPHGRLLEGPEGYAKYKETTDEVLKISATLDDTKKVKYFIYPHLENDVRMNQSFHIVEYIFLTCDFV